ncbi:MAG TPA: M28 family peptidase [Chthoniobacterales bacterium]|nr:M28 family peptidase [Chthoniobacterales bacterium]
MAHLGQIATQPRPIGSDYAIKVREYLVAQLASLGGEVRVEPALGTAQNGRNFHSGIAHNIVATFAGQSNTRAVMLVAHYDSVAEGPGAADDGAGLIVILESLRAARVSGPLKNDIIVLFSDGEEARGLLGAKAFVTAHPELKDRIGLMVNLEARGSSGPSLMFETSDENGALIREFKRASPYPMASSLMASVYKLLPNDTDFTPLKAAGLTGLNFAFLETYQNYHTRLDTIENLDARSVQHMGANVHSIIRHFGNLSEMPKEAPDRVYFNPFGSWLLVYPAWLAWTIALLLPIVFSFACFRSAWSSGLTLRRTAAGLGCFLLQLLVIAGSALVAFAAAKLVTRESLEGDTFSNQLLFEGIMGIALGLGLISQRFFGQKLGFPNLAVGQLIAVSFLSVPLCSLLIGGSYVLQWPLVFAMTGMLLSLRLTGAGQRVCQLIFLIPGLLVLVPLAYMFFVALSFTYIAVAAAGFLLTVVLAMAPQLLDSLLPSWPSRAIVFVASLVLIGAGIRLSVWSKDHPRRNTLIYSVNADHNKAKWVSYDPAPDAWTGLVLGNRTTPHSDPDYTAGLLRPVLASEATSVSATPPSATVVQESTAGDLRSVRLQIGSTRGARTVIVRVPGEVELSAAGWNGNLEPVHQDSQSNAPWSLRFYNLPPEGASLELRFVARNSVRLWIADTTPGLPNIAPLAQRPDDTTPGYGSDVTLVARSIEL